MSERSPNSRLRIVVLGYIVRCPLGGLAWHHLQYALGLSRPGHEVLFLEDSGDDVWACYDPTTNVTGPDPTYGLGFTSRTFERVGLSESWAYHDALAGSWHGPAADRALEMCRTADLLINLSGSNVLRPWTASVPARVFLDTDSAFTQLRNVVDAARRDRALAHTAFFTFGENIGSPSCRVPDDGIRWLPTRQPIVLDAWPVAPGPAKGRLTTVLQWDDDSTLQGVPLQHDGRSFGRKRASFEPFLDLPVGSPSAAPATWRAGGRWWSRTPASPRGYDPIWAFSVSAISTRPAMPSRIWWPVTRITAKPRGRSPRATSRRTACSTICSTGSSPADAMLDRMPARSGEIVRLDTSRLLPAGCHFNPSLVTAGGNLWMVYRRVTPDPDVDLVSWPRELALCRLNADLQPDPDSNVDLSARIEDPPQARRWHADARFFLRAGRPWLSYHDNHDLFIVALDPERVPDRLRPQRLTLQGRPRRERERNWGLFDDGELKAIYTIDPHVVVGLTESATGFEARPIHETRPGSMPSAPWDSATSGEPHGGTAPIRLGDCWFSFFQSSVLANPGSEQKVYVVGFYGFDVRPPHPIRFLSTRPILEGRDLEGPLSFWNDYAVAYPSGAVATGGRWLLSIGIHDRAIGLVAFDHAELLAGCAAL